MKTILMALTLAFTYSCTPIPVNDLGSGLKDKNYKTSKVLKPKQGYYILQRDGSFYKVEGSDETFTLNQ